MRTDVRIAAIISLRASTVKTLTGPDSPPIFDIANKSSHSEGTELSEEAASEMPYLIETYDKPDHFELRTAVRDEHLEYLAENASLLLACGTKIGDDGQGASGGIYVVDLESREEAERFIAADPFYKADLFAEVAITRWRKAYLDGVCYL